MEHTFNNDNEAVIHTLISNFGLKSLTPQIKGIKISDFSQINYYIKQGYFVFTNMDGVKCYAINRLAALKIIQDQHLENNVFFITKENFLQMLEQNFTHLNTIKSKYYLDFLAKISTAKNIQYKKIMFLFFGMCFVLAKFTPNIFTTLNNLIYFGQNILKSMLFHRSLVAKKLTIDKAGYQQNNLPIYTILIPLYKEKHKLNNIINNIAKLNYPKDKLDVKIIIEADDLETINALAKIAIPEYMHVIKVPYSIPRTKPKAMNYA